MTSERMAGLETLEAEVRACPLCDLSKTRTRAVPGEGPADAEVMFIGEAPGYNEDKQGRPFVGQAGHLLDELLAEIDLDRSRVYITNVLKCRPPQNRDPLPHEIEACAPYLRRQVALLKPKVVVTLGRYSMAKVFPGASISRIHGQPKRIGQTMYLPLYHPAAILRRPDLMGAMKADMRKIPVLLEEMRAAPAGDGEAQPIAQDEAPVQLGLFDM